LFCLLKQIIGQLSADADCQMADTDYRTDYRPIIGAPIIENTVVQVMRRTQWHYLYKPKPAYPAQHNRSI